MSKISGSFLVGFAFVASVGVASAQGMPEMSNSLSDRAASVEGMRASVKLGQAKPSNPLTDAAASLMSAPTSAGMANEVLTVRQKIGSGTDFNPMSNSLVDAPRESQNGMVNQLQMAQSASTDSGLRANVVLGGNTADFSNQIGDQVRNDIRLGK